MNEYIKFLALFMGAVWLVGCGMLTPVNTNQPQFGVPKVPSMY